MVLGAGFWQIPLINTVKEMGYSTLATDYNPDAEGREFADRFEAVNITDIDATLVLAREVGVVGIVSDQTDLSVPTLAAVTSELGLPGPSPETAFNTTNKGQMRRLAAVAGLKNPRFRICDSSEIALNAIEEDHPDAPGGVGFPCVVKPTDSQASRGVQLVQTGEELGSACEEAFRFTREGKILIEQFIKGTEVTVEGCRYAGETHLLGVSAKRHTPPPHIIAMHLDFPAPLPDKALAEIKNVYLKLVDALGIEAGSIHGELIVNDDGIFLVEMANRGGGSGTSSHIIPTISGVNLLRSNVLYATGKEEPVVPTSNNPVVLRFLLFQPGKVESISGIEEINEIDDVVTFGLYIKPGDILVPPVMDTQRHGYIITTGETLEIARDVAKKVESTVQLTYLGGN